MKIADEITKFYL